MGVEMFHHVEIMDAICGICSGWVKLAEDAGGSDVVRVGSNRLFRAGDAVEIVDDETVPESHTIAQLAGLTDIVLEAAVAGSYQVSRQARLVRKTVSGPELAWVGRGRPDVGPQPVVTSFPCVVVEPARLEQALQGGTNRAVAQDYWTHVHYVRRRVGGEEGDAKLLEEVRALFNLLMADPYLGGTCWHSQVTQVQYAPRVEAALQERGAPARAVLLEVIARRIEARPTGG